LILQLPPKRLVGGGGALRLDLVDLDVRWQPGGREIQRVKRELQDPRDLPNYQVRRRPAPPMLHIVKVLNGNGHAVLLLDARSDIFLAHLQFLAAARNHSPEALHDACFSSTPSAASEISVADLTGWAFSELRDLEALQNDVLRPLNRDNTLTGTTKEAVSDFGPSETLIPFRFWDRCYGAQRGTRRLGLG